MKKICILFVCAFFVSTMLSACDTRPKPNMVQGKRRFEKYVQPIEAKKNSFVDLSEGPKLNYDGYLGPQNLNFDIKIINPY